MYDVYCWEVNKIIVLSMFQGNWKCSSCGGAITELPFEPRSESGLTCRDCYRKQKDSSQSDAPSDAVATEPAPDAPDFADLATDAPPADIQEGQPVTSGQAGERKMFTGEWKCAGCGGTISSLPFEPRDTSNLKCLDCFKKSKA